MWSNICDFVKSMYASCPFLTGIVLGVVGCAVAVLLFRLLFRLFGSSKVSAFSYPVSDGQITIRAAAVTSLIFSLEKDFPEFAVSEAGLYRKGGIIFLRVVVDYRQGRRPFPDVAALFQKTALDKMKEIFGIGSVRKVEVRMRDSIAAPERSGE